MTVDAIPRPCMTPAEEAAFRRAVRSAKIVDGAFVELGVLHGGSTIAILQEIADDARRLISVDVCRAVKPHWRRAAEHAGPRWELTFLRMTTREAASRVDGPLAFVLFDAGHCHACVSGDMAAWLPKVVPGGVAVFHDTGRRAQMRTERCGCSPSGAPFGVAHAIDESADLAAHFQLVEEVDEDGTRSGIRVYRRRS